MKLLKIMFFFVLMLFVQPHASACGARTTREVKEFCMTISELISLGVSGLSSGALAQGGVPATKTLHKPAQSQNSEEYEAPPLRDASKASAPVAQLAQAMATKNHLPQQPPTVVSAKTPASCAQSMPPAGPAPTPVVSNSHPQQFPAAAAKIPAFSTQGACTAVSLAPLAALYARTFAQGHTKQQARDMTRFLLPITLEPKVLEEYVRPSGFLRWDKPFFIWEDGEKSYDVCPVEDDYDNLLGHNVPWKLREPISWDLNREKDMEFSVDYNSHNARVRKCSDSQTGPRDLCDLYALPNQDNVRAIKWLNTNNKLITIKFGRTDDKPGYTYKQTAFAWDFQPFEAFTEGIIGSEQLALILVLHDVQKKNHVPLSLSDCAVLAQESGITTAELARVLLTFPEELQDHILKHMHISTKKNSDPNQNQTKEDEEQQPEDYLERYQAFEQAKDIVLGQADGKAASSKNYDVINKELEGLIVDERPHGKDKRYVDLFVRIRNTDSYYQTAMVELAGAIQAHDLKRVQDNLNYQTIRGSIKFIARMCCGETSWGSIPLLHEAIRYCESGNPMSDEIFKAILHYQEQLVPDSKEWKTYKHSFKDALQYALELKQYNCAQQIGQKMMQDPELRADAEYLVKNQRPLMGVMAVLSGNADKK